MSLTKYINENIPGLKAGLIPHGNMFQIVR